jgi:hypothetical protein
MLPAGVQRSDGPDIVHTTTSTINPPVHDVHRSDGPDIVRTSTPITNARDQKAAPYTVTCMNLCCGLIIVLYPLIIGYIIYTLPCSPPLPPTSPPAQPHSPLVANLQRFEAFQSTYGLRKSSLRFIWGENASKIKHDNFSVVVAKGDTFVPFDPAFIFPFPGAFQYTGHVFTPHDYEYVEVMHFYRRKDHQPLRDIPSVGQFWYYSAPGSGIWMNLGRALRMRTAGKYSPGCEYALDNGYDTYVLSPDNTGLPSTQSYYGGMVEIVDCAGGKADRNNLHIVWEYACPHEDYSMLYQMKNAMLEPCNCSNSVSYLNCLKS